MNSGILNLAHFLITDKIRSRGFRGTLTIFAAGLLEYRSTIFIMSNRAEGDGQGHGMVSSGMVEVVVKVLVKR